jgi:DNA-binding PadR family transcriptional regulator
MRLEGRGGLAVVADGKRTRSGGVVYHPAQAYIWRMSKEQVKAILDRVLTWPADRQEDAAKVLMLMETQDDSVYRLTDEQVQEVQRRRNDPNAKRLTLEEFNDRLRRLTGE